MLCKDGLNAENWTEGRWRKEDVISIYSSEYLVLLPTASCQSGPKASISNIITISCLRCKLDEGWGLLPMHDKFCKKDGCFLSFCCWSIFFN